MKFSITKLVLLEALTVTGKCITTPSIIPALSCYKFDIDNDRLEITGGNIAVFITQSVEIVGSGFQRSICIPQSVLFGWIKELADQPIEFTVEEREINGVTNYSVEIVASDAKCLIPCENGKDYPDTTQAVDHSFEINSTDLFTGIDKTIFACAKDILKPSLSGLNLIIGEEGITFNGCDGYNMATRTFALIENADIKTDIAIPTGTMAIVRSIPCDEKVKITFSNRNIKFQLNESTVLRSMLIDTAYPAVKGIIPNSNDKIALIETRSLVGALKRTVQFTPPGYPVLSLKFADGLLKINAVNDIGEAATENLKIDYQGEPIDIRLNGVNTLKCLSRMDDSTVKLTLGLPSKGVVISDMSNDITQKLNLMLTMPVYKEQ